MTLFVFVIVRPFDNSLIGYNNASKALSGEPFNNELVQDIIGANALLNGGPAYPVLGEAFLDYGIKWDVKHATTHAPTAFLLALPLMLFEWVRGVQLWAWFGLILLALGLMALGVPLSIAIPCAVLLLWWQPVTFGAVQQMTVVIFALTAFAYRLRSSHPYVSGAFLALASFPKMFPAVIAFAFTVGKNYRALMGFMVTVLLGVLLIAIMNTSAIVDYFNIESSAYTIARTDNASPIVILSRLSIFAPLVLIALLGTPLKRGMSKKDDAQVWAVMSVASVALLPIAWVYSIVPLLFPMVILWQRGQIAYVIATLSLSFIFPPFGALSIYTPLIACTILCVGFMRPIDS